MNSIVEKVTDRIIERSRWAREAYLSRIDEMASHRWPARSALGASNFAHDLAACSGFCRERLFRDDVPNIAIISSYNDLLSAHAPFEAYHRILKEVVFSAGGAAQFAGGVPAMCDGITQGYPGMDLSLMTRDVIAMSVVTALSHMVFDGALLLGVCDKIMPGLLMGMLQYGHLPAILVPAGPMRSGIANREKALARERFAVGEIGKQELIEYELKAYHSEGTCTFYGTANSNQLMAEMLGVHLPGASFINTGTKLREAMTREAGRRIVELARPGGESCPIGHIINEKSVVNALVGLLATGGSTNESMHLVAIAKAAGVIIDWQDFAELSDAVPLIVRIYPNGPEDINAFQEAGGIPLIIQELLNAGFLHGDVKTVAGDGLLPYSRQPVLDDNGVKWMDKRLSSRNISVISTVQEPFDRIGGIKVLEGNLGRAIMKISALSQGESTVIEAPARVFNSQEEMEEAFRNERLNCDHVAVVRFQGPRANGMPELHKLITFLSIVMDRGFQVGLLTDGRLSGASGKVPFAIHCTPEAACGGPISRLVDGDIIRMDARAGVLEARVPALELKSREPANPDLREARSLWGREIFAPLRMNLSSADQGASAIFCGEREGVCRPVVAEIGSGSAYGSMNGIGIEPFKVLERSPVIPVVVIEELNDAVPLARALLRGGIKVIEVTLRSEAALEAISLINREVPEILVGAGTVLNSKDLMAVAEAGASFAISPGMTQELLEVGQDGNIPLIPGISTVSELMCALEMGFEVFKFFPAEAAGGVDMLRSIAGPFPGVRFCPTGGIGESNFLEYLALANVICVGGSWVAPIELIRKGHWDSISVLASDALQAARDSKLWGP